MIFAHPYIFLLTLLLPVLIYLYVYRERHKPASFSLSSTASFTGYKPGIRVYLRHIPFILICFALLLSIVALARPQSINASRESETKGINIMMVMDISTSMLAQDLQPDRFEAAKDQAAHFIQNRPNDNIGLVAFAGESFVQCPLTTDHASLLNLLQSLQMGIIQDGTAIGDGIATAVGRLKEINNKSKVIILLTDGSNNAGALSPKTATEMAKTFGIKVYTIGVGTHGMAPYPIQTPFGVQFQKIEVDIDEPMLEYIAETTGGKYFRATNTESLKNIYNDIDKLEKVKIKTETIQSREDLFVPFLLGALVCSIIALIGRLTLFRVLP